MTELHKASNCTCKAGKSNMGSAGTVDIGKGLPHNSWRSIQLQKLEPCLSEQELPEPEQLELVQLEQWKVEQGLFEQGLLERCCDCWHRMVSDRTERIASQSDLVQLL